MFQHNLHISNTKDLPILVMNHHLIVVLNNSNSSSNNNNNINKQIYLLNRKFRLYVYYKNFKQFFSRHKV